MGGTGQQQAAKRAFVKVLLRIAGLYKVACSVNRDSADSALLAAYRRVQAKCHPDKGGLKKHAQELNTARDEWDQARQPRQQPEGGEPPPAGPGAADPGQSMAVPEKGFRVHSSAVLLTYNGITDIAHWRHLVAFLEAHLREWSIKYWCATLEENKQRKLHAHAMLQFHRKVDVFSKRFAFDGLAPNAGPNNRPGEDLCGEGLCRKRLQQSIDRGMFYVFADKNGTVRDAAGKPIVQGNYFPCWTGERCTYQVLARWYDTLWKQHKLRHEVYEDYIYLGRDGVQYRKRNLDAVQAHEDDKAESLEIEAVTKRIKSNPALYQPFPQHPEAEAWLQQFSGDALRYPVMIVLGTSGRGKTEWAKSLFKNPLTLLIGTLAHFPEEMRKFQRKLHDGLVLDDVRDLAFVTNNQEKLQGKYDARVEFASTAGGTCAFKKWLFACPVVVTANYSTANLDFLGSHDWLGKPLNRVVVHF